MLEPRDFMVPVVDIDFPEVKAVPPITDWSNFEQLVPRPSISSSGMYLERRGRAAAPIIRHIIRREAHERTVTHEEQGHRMEMLSRPKVFYVPPGLPSGSTTVNHHLAASGFKNREAPNLRETARNLPPIKLNKLRHRSGRRKSSPSKLSSPGEDVDTTQPQIAENRESGAPVRRGTSSMEVGNRHMSVMDRAAQGITEVLWQEKKPSPGPQSSSSVGAHRAATPDDNWDAYCKLQRATITAQKTFTWGGRQPYKGTDLSPHERINFQAGVRKRPVQL